MTSTEILQQLVAIPSITGGPNRPIVALIERFLQERNVPTRVFWTDDGQKANLFATLGPAERPGIVLSGHMDVVPVEGQSWTSDPFRLVERDGRLYGRGAADMKGFLACALSLVDRAARVPLQTPLHLCFSYDEEIGCVGVRSMLARLAAEAVPARFCIVGEPTGMRVATGHKGKIAARAVCRGAEAHSAYAPLAQNAIHLAADFISILRRSQRRLAQAGGQDGGYEVPYSTIHAGRINGGVALNIVPSLCTVDFEIRTIGADDGQGILRRIQSDAERLVKRRRTQHPAADIVIEVVNAYPGLDTAASAEVVSYVTSLAGNEDTAKVVFGTEAGLFSEMLGTPTVICGPGSMDQGHKPDEFIAREQLDRCDAMFDRLLARIAC